MSIYTNIKALIRPFIDGIEVFFDGLPDAPITAISIQVTAGTVERRQGTSHVEYRIKLVSRSNDPELARTSLYDVYVGVDGRTNFYAEQDSFVSLFCDGPPVLRGRGVGGEATYTMLLTIKRREM